MPKSLPTSEDKLSFKGEETYLNWSGNKKEEPRNNRSPWSTGCGPCPEVESLNLHGSLVRKRNGRNKY